MKTPFSYKVFLLAPLVASAFLGVWVGSSVSEGSVSKDVEYIVDKYEHYISGPVKDVESFLMVAQKPKYAKYALTNALALGLTDIYYPNISGIIYHNAIKHLTPWEKRAFVSMYGGRILEEDRLSFDPDQYPKEVAKVIERKFEERPVINLTKSETNNLLECTKHIRREGIDPRNPLEVLFGVDYKHEDPCGKL